MKDVTIHDNTKAAEPPTAESTEKARLLLVRRGAIRKLKSSAEQYCFTCGEAHPSREVLMLGRRNQVEVCRGCVAFATELLSGEAS